MTQALIMDLDGTLIDSVPDVCASLNRALASAGLTPLRPGQVRKMVGHGARIMIEHAVRESGGDRDLNIDALRDLFLTEYSARPVENTVIYPGVVDVLDIFRAQGIRLGICTNKPEKTTYPVLDALGLRDYFPAIVCGDTLPYSKPDPRHVHKVVEMLGGAAAGAVFVGDSETDVAAARNAGLPIVLVSYGYTLSPPQGLGADVLIDHFGDLPGVLLDMEGWK
mgnify:CR=1 FL=1